MTIKMTNKARKAAHSLAVIYSAYNAAVSNDLDREIKIWGEMLLKAQDETGIELTKRELILSILSYKYII